ncbi:MAG: DUF2157 domain-containing protein, partial [bacterium]|nr:DUF2157 domain-containing protein [bacterium]
MANDKKKRSFSDKLMKVTTDRFSGSRLLLVYGGGAALIALWTIGLIILNGLGTTPAVVFAGVMGALTLVYVGYFFLGKHMRIALATTFIVFGLVWGVAAMRGDFAAEDRDNGRNDRLVIPVTPKPRTNDPLPPSIEPPTELPDGLVAHGSVGKVPIPVDDGKEDEKTIRGPTTGTEDNRIDITGSLGDPDKNDPSKTPDFSIAYSERPKIVDMVQPKYPDIARDM